MKTKTRSRAAGRRTSAETPAPRRGRQGGVRSRILELLAGGALLAQDLLDRGGFSPAALYLNLKALKAEGFVDTARDGRSVRYALTGDPAGVPAGRTSQRRSRTAAGVAPAAGELQQALVVLMSRLAPIEDIDEKLMVLGQLADALPAPVASVLNAVIDDLGRLTGKR